jgi:hypothetical protein
VLEKDGLRVKWSDLVFLDSGYSKYNDILLNFEILISDQDFSYHNDLKMCQGSFYSK